MLPSNPLHHLLMQDIAAPIVATSGNLSEEPICTDENEAMVRLGGIADLFLTHNRPIVRHVDDSIVRIILDRELILRRARGYAPLPLHCRRPLPPMLAVGGHLKNSVAMTAESNIFLSQHIGDLENKEATDAFHHVIKSFRELYGSEPKQVACDLHPDYISGKFAREMGLPVLSVQHHFAHVTACAAENEIEGQVLGVSWDGTGFGPDGTVWGGECLLASGREFNRFASFRTFRLPGNERAVKEPRRTAVGLLYEIFGNAVFDKHNLLPVAAFSQSDLSVLSSMLASGFNSPRTSSVGRLFDAVASLCGLRQKISFEGQAAMELEFALVHETTEKAYPFILKDSGSDVWVAGVTEDATPIREVQARFLVNWIPSVHAILRDIDNEISHGEISAKFHNMLVEIIVEVAKRSDEEHLVLTGGCFQNKYLLEHSVRKLRALGFKPHWHQRIPPNDGGIALGQIVAASRMPGS